MDAIKLQVTSEEKKQVDEWAGQIMCALILSPQNFGGTPLEIAKESYNFASKLLEVRRDIYRDP